MAKGKLINIIFYSFIFAALVYFGCITYQHQVKLNAIATEKEKVGKTYLQLEEENKLLAQEKIKLADNQYIEKIAREDLGLVKKGETPIIKSSNN